MSNLDTLKDNKMGSAYELSDSPVDEGKQDINQGARRFPPSDYHLKHTTYQKNKDYRLVDSEGELERVSNILKSLNPDHVISYKAETTGPNFYRRISREKKDVIVAHVLSWENAQAVIIPIRMQGRRNVSIEVFNRYMKDILETRRILAHNGANDVRYLLDEGINLNLKEDTFHLAKHLMPYIGMNGEGGFKTKSRSTVTGKLEDLAYRIYGTEFPDTLETVYDLVDVSESSDRKEDIMSIQESCTYVDRMRLVWQVLRTKLDDRQVNAYKTTIKFSKICSIKSTYEGIKLAEPKGMLSSKAIEGIYHPEPKVGGTETWRTVERTLTLDEKAKENLVAYDKEHYFVSLNYLSKELRLVANESDDYGLMNILEDPEVDPHTLMGSSLTGIKQHKITERQRSVAKVIPIATMCNIGTETIAKNINKTVTPTQEQLEETEHLCEQFKQIFKPTISTLQTIGDKVRENGYLTNKLGYKMVCDDIIDLEDYESQIFCTERQNPPTIKIDPIELQEQDESLSEKVNKFLTQSTAAGILMSHIVSLYDTLEEYGIQDKVAMPIIAVDEINFIVHQSVDPYLLLKILVDTFELKMFYQKERTVPLYIGIGFGHSWGEARSERCKLSPNLQHKLIEKYERGRTPKSLLVKDIPHHFRKAIISHIRQRIRDEVPNIMRNRIYSTGEMIDALRENPHLLKKGTELFGFYDIETDVYDHDKILKTLCSDTNLRPHDFVVENTEPTKK